MAKGRVENKLESSIDALVGGLKIHIYIKLDSFVLLFVVFGWVSQISINGRSENFKYNKTLKPTTTIF